MCSQWQSTFVKPWKDITLHNSSYYQPRSAGEAVRTVGTACINGGCSWAQKGFGERHLSDRFQVARRKSSQLSLSDYLWMTLCVLFSSLWKMVLDFEILKIFRLSLFVCFLSKHWFTFFPKWINSNSSKVQGCGAREKKEGKSYLNYEGWLISLYRQEIQ